MSGHLVATLGRYCMVTINSNNGLEMYVFVYKLTKYTSNTRDILMFWLDNQLERKKCMFHIIVLKGGFFYLF